MFRIFGCWLLGGWAFTWGTVSILTFVWFRSFVIIVQLAWFDFVSPVFQSFDERNYFLYVFVALFFELLCLENGLVMFGKYVFQSVESRADGRDGFA